MLTEEEAKEEVLKLIEKFKSYPKNKIESLAESQICRLFIIPMFNALGWETDSPDEVIEQVNQPDGKPDYVFYLNENIAFFLEAKRVKPLEDKDIKQAVNYARYKNKRWAVLSNFEETYILICDTKEKNLKDHVFKSLHISVLDVKFDKLWLISKESFQKGLIEKDAQADGRIKRSVQIDDELLDDILTWRRKLITSIKENNKKDYIKEDLEDIAQVFLNRLIFIRTVEDRKHEAKPDDFIKNILVEYENNRELNIKKRLNKIFQEYDKVYDSKLFTYSETDESIRHECEIVEVDNKTLFNILSELYEKNDLYTYDFSEIDADILGSMYEKYIGNIQSKRKEQGIYYTPTFIVDYIVKNTLGEILDNKKLTLEKIRALDPACGSGSFLLKTFDYIDQYLKKKDKNYAQTQLGSGDEKTRITTRTRILRDNIFGVDLDSKAVEITQLTLLLKAADTKYQLPNLKNNIQCGNSLIESDKLLEEKAFSWQQKFKNIIKFDETSNLQEGFGFDVIIGNPPYVSWDSISKSERKLFESGKYLDLEYHCRPNHKDAQPNYYLFFIVRCTNLLKKDGLFSFIIPQEWLYHNYAMDFRNYILAKFNQIQITQFNPNYKVFRNLNETVGTNSLILTLRKSGAKSIVWNYIPELDDVSVQRQLVKRKFTTTISKTHKELFNSVWNFAEIDIEKIRKKINDLPNLAFLDDENYFEVKGGFQPPINAIPNFEITENDFIKLNKAEKELVFPVIYDAKEIKRYNEFTNKNKLWILANDVSSEEELKNKYGEIYEILSNRLSKNKKDWWHFPNIRNFELIKKYHSKILSPRTAKISSFTIDNNRSVFKGTNTMVISKSLPLKYVLGILNSSLSNFWYSKFGFNYHGGASKKYEPDKTKRFSIPIKISNDTKISELVDKLFVINKKILSIGNNQTTEKQRLEEESKLVNVEIDELVYKLYGLTKEEIELIEKS